MTPQYLLEVVAHPCSWRVIYTSRHVPKRVTVAMLISSMGTATLDCFPQSSFPKASDSAVLCQRIPW